MSKIEFHSFSSDDAVSSGATWFPYNKGGEFRKWYGMNEYVVNWQNDGYKIRNLFENGKQKSRPQNTKYYFKNGITWSLFGFENFGVRYKDCGFVFDVSGSSMFPSQEMMLYLLAFLASKVAFMYLSILAPTVNFQVGNIGDLPLLIDEKIKPQIDILAKENVLISPERNGMILKSPGTLRNILYAKQKIIIWSIYTRNGNRKQIRDMRN